MRILLINPPHLSIGSRIPKEQLPPLGLLSIGGPLIDAGYEVRLLDADYKPMKFKDIVATTIEYYPDAILLGHSGSTAAQPIINEITRLIRQELPNIKVVIGGVFPSYHWQEILEKNPQIDVIVCGEGEDTICKLFEAFENQINLLKIKGIAFRLEGAAFKTLPADIIQNLDNYRVGWELMLPYQYTYWGDIPAVVVQFSRGCPYPCNYCGQSLFWKKWRHRNPQKFAKELAMLYKTYGIKMINFADENPTTNKKIWKEFLEALIEEDVPLILVGSTRADNIVRDEDILHLYKKAGFERFLMGIENYDAITLDMIKKKGSITKDKKAIQLLRKHNILSMATYVTGFVDETLKDYLNGLKQLLLYDPDQIQMLYVTPHKWTPFFELVEERQIIQNDQRKWDYKHQVLATKNLSPWQVILLVKGIELIMQLRPKSLQRWLFHKDLRIRDAMRWYYRIGRKVWFYELFCFFFRDKVKNKGMKLKDFWE